MMNPPQTTITSFQYPESIYSRLVHLDRTLPNIEKWAISFDGEPYDPTKTYDLLKFVYKRYNLGQLYELRQIIQLFYKPIHKDSEILSMFTGDTSKNMARLITEYCQDGYTYRYTNPNEPTCQCFTIDCENAGETTKEFRRSSRNNQRWFTIEGYYREDERTPTCRECHGYEEPPKTDETTDEHFHLIPFPQRTHMNFPFFIWVLAFILEGYQYEFARTPLSEAKAKQERRRSVGVRGFACEASVSGWRPKTPSGLSGEDLSSNDNAEYEPTHVMWNQECENTYTRASFRCSRNNRRGFILEGYCTHQYFKFYARYTPPSKTELRNYQEYRNLCGEYFVEIPKRPKPTPESSTHTKRYPNFPKRYDPIDEPQWWETDRMH